ncbi:hypothetical protein J6590_025667 [Homalodisca vitripennis]|nr:hypothetical protein J6590_025667 [Homalodisca vitripennis]
MLIEGPMCILETTESHSVVAGTSYHTSHGPHQDVEWEFLHRARGGVAGAHHHADPQVLQGAGPARLSVPAPLVTTAATTRRRVLVIPADSDTAAPTQTDDHRTADPRTADHSLDVFTSRTSLAT